MQNKETYIGICVMGGILIVGTILAKILIGEMDGFIWGMITGLAALALGRIITQELRKRRMPPDWVARR